MRRVLPVGWLHKMAQVGYKTTASRNGCRECSTGGAIFDGKLCKFIHNIVAGAIVPERDAPTGLWVVI